MTIAMFRGRGFFLLCLAGLYTGILMSPGFMGSVVDKSQGSFSAQPTAMGGRAMVLRAKQTIRWAQELATNGGMANIRICEIGPGRGILAKQAAEQGNEYLAIDMDQAAIDRIRPYAEWSFCGRVPPMPDDMPRADAFVCENVIEHLSSHDEVKALLLACRAKMRTIPNGVIVLRFPEIKYSRWRFYDTQDHQYVTSLARITSLCRECGFEIERCGYSFDHLDGWRGKLAWSAKRCFPWQVMHDLFYEPWQTSPWSTLAQKVPHGYVVAKKGYGVVIYQLTEWRE